MIQLRYCVFGVLIAIAFYVAIIPLKLTMAHINTPIPQAILTLGGSADREEFAAQLAYQNPELEVWVSTGERPIDSIRIFSAAGIPLSRVHLDYQATDTVTNFTTTVNQFQQRNIKHIYLLTSDFHMRRAQAIAFLVLGSRGIAYTPITVASNARTESTLHIIRDIGRSLLWITTGKTGAGIGREVENFLKVFLAKESMYPG